ncbi:MAG: SWIM zinc finger family protein [Synergistaceae bacterium]
MFSRRYQWKYTKPKTARGGIKSRFGRGLFHASNWWSRKWIEVIESSIDSGHLSRGKNYAKRGQVTSIEIEPGLVTAFVQGTRTKPYQIKLGFETATDEAKRSLLSRLSEQAFFVANLLVQNMPDEMEQVFKEVGIQLLPTSTAIRKFKCTCPDESAPCKHIVAVLYLLAEVIDDDPFLLLKLRGIEQDELIEHLTKEVNKDNFEYDDFYDDEDIFTMSGGAEYEGELSTLNSPKDEFDLKNWYGNSVNDVTFEIEEKTKSTTVLDIMNEFPFWRGEVSFRKTFMPYYERVCDRAYELLLGEKKTTIGRPKKLL